MSIVVFSGPSLSPIEVRGRLPGCQAAGPAGCGDIYRAAKQGATAIGLIDGSFDHRLSVWHKEVLWALSRGVRVYGAASIGALRGAELCRFGMQGVGQIFAWYRDGVLENDDEVAVTHEPAERGYTPRSEPLVNVRATLARALDTEVLRAPEDQVLIAIGRELFYAQRTWPAILSAALEKNALPRQLVERLQKWLGTDPSPRIDQKRLDALALLDRLDEDQRTAAAAASPEAEPFVFEYTEPWHELLRRLEGETAAASPREAWSPAAGLARKGGAPGVGIRLLELIAAKAPHRLDAIRRRARDRALALAQAAGRAAAPENVAVQAASNGFRRARGLLSADDTEAWLEARVLDLAAFSQLMYEEATLEAAAGAPPAEADAPLHAHVPAVVALDGEDELVDLLQAAARDGSGAKVE